MMRVAKVFGFELEVAMQKRSSRASLEHRKVASKEARRRVARLRYNPADADSAHLLGAFHRRR